MSATATQRLEQLDRDAEAMKDGFVEAISDLQMASGADTSLEVRWERIAGRLHQLRHDLRREDFDKEQVLALSTTMLDIHELRDGLHGPDRLNALNELLVNLERIRHVIRDALDEHVDVVEGSARSLAHELLARLPGATRAEVSTLLGIDPRTLSRWLSSEKAPARRLRVVSRLVAVLRHSWSEEGRLAWFHRARRDLGGCTPLQILDAAPIDEEALISAARAGRSQYAS